MGVHTLLQNCFIYTLVAPQKQLLKRANNTCYSQLETISLYKEHIFHADTIIVPTTNIVIYFVHTNI